MQQARSPTFLPPTFRRGTPRRKNPKSQFKAKTLPPIRHIQIGLEV
jgi:hypothetical protein